VEIGLVTPFHGSLGAFSTSLWPLRVADAQENSPKPHVSFQKDKRTLMARTTHRRALSSVVAGVNADMVILSHRVQPSRCNLMRSVPYTAVLLFYAIKAVSSC
jgi:hypothetical protein